MRVLFVQFGNSMFPRFDSSDGYWDAFYSHYNDYGYWRMDDAFEVPKWIAEASHFLPQDCFRKICWVRHSVQEAVDEIKYGRYDFVLFSVMTCTKGFTETIISSTSSSQCYIVGGYDKWIYDAPKRHPNVVAVDTMEDTAAAMGLGYRLGTDYSLFRGWTVLPRLTLSTGCLNNCRFCIIPHRLETIPDEAIFQQVDSFRDLCFRLVYIDDKTFGQAANYRMLKGLKERILEYNPDFTGFVVQTTSGILASRADEFRELGVAVAEIGFETANDGILKQYRKPSTTALATRAIENGSASGINVIVNIIVGFFEETEKTYQNTLGFIRSHSHQIFGYNFAIYTDYSSDECVGEVDFMDDGNTELHRKYWDILNDEAKAAMLNHAPLEQSCVSADAVV